jgi:apolipoprotein N-acyltransferase
MPSLIFPLQPGPSAIDSSLTARVPTWVWLILGVVLTGLTANRWNIALLGWIAPVPFLVVAQRLHGVRGSLLLLLVLTTATTLQTLKIITAPLPAPIALMFSVPAAVSWWLLLMVWTWFGRRLGRVWGLYVFVALSTFGDWISLAFSYAGAWATSANSQIDNLPMLQLTALGGLSLVGALMALVAGNVFLVIDSPTPKVHRRHSAAAFVALIGALAWGAMRLDQLDLGPTLRVAGIVTHLGLGQGMPSAAALATNTDDLFARSELAAQRGAQIVAWNEVATLVSPETESAIRTRGSDLARRNGIDFVMAYGVLLQSAPLLIDNKYEWFGPDGSSLEVYRKHHPVPGEPALAGDAPIQVLARPWGRAAGAICYDYDFPALAREQAQGDAGLVIVPASDWRGIDPYHTLMARVRGIEGGMAVVRPVRDATSMMFDAYGRVRASQGAWEGNEGILIGTVPTQHIKTVYTALGDWPAGLAAGLLLIACLRATRRRSQTVDPADQINGESAKEDVVHQ